MSDLKQRISSSTKTSAAADPTTTDHDPPTSSKPIPPPSQQPPSFSQRAVSQTLASTAHLANLLPTGSLLAFQLLTPIFTNNGSCDSTTRILTIILIILLAISCFFACFTDSFTASNGRVYYGFATFKGMWLFDYPGTSRKSDDIPDLMTYRLRFVDWVHAVLSVLVFGVVVFKDKNFVSCFYPKPSHGTQEVLDIVPVGVGLICSLLFVAFPTKRHGIGYPVTPTAGGSK